MVEPSEALFSVENALRLVVQSVWGDSWEALLGEDGVSKLREKAVAESKLRDGAVTTDNLLAFTELYQLTGLVRKQWESFVTVFKDKRRTEVFFHFLNDVRNAIAHSRELVVFERDLLGGMSIPIRNQIAEFRTANDPASAHYLRSSR